MFRFWLSILLLTVTVLAIGAFQYFGIVHSSFTAGTLADFADPGVYRRLGPTDAVWLVRFPKGNLVAMNARCTATPCLVDWRPAKKVFRCPCQSCGFRMDGVNIEGPAPRPLERYKIVLKGEDVIVDTGVVFRGELNEWTSTDSYVQLKRSGRASHLFGR